MAWEDVKQNEGWMKKALLLGLIQVVPILNFTVSGYAAQWGKDPVLNRKRPLPQKIFDDNTFVTGFYYWLLSIVVLLAVYVVSAVIGGLLGMVGGFLGITLATVLGAVVGIWGGMVAFAGGMRCALGQRIGAGFQIGEIFNGAKGHWGKLFCACFVPGLLVGLVVALIGIVVSLIVAVAGGVGLVGLIGSGSRSVNVAALMGTLGVGALLYLVVGYIGCCGTAMAQLISFRAVGYWTARYAPQWAGLAYATPNAGAAMASGAAYVPPAPIPPSSSGTKPLVQGTSGATQLPAGDDSSTTVLTGQGRQVLRLERSDGTVVAVSQFPATVGKGSAATVQLQGNSAISREHLRISQTDGLFVVEDLQSTNGTLVNDSALAPGTTLVLRHNDRLKLGDEVIAVLLD